MKERQKKTRKTKRERTKEQTSHNVTFATRARLRACANKSEEFVSREFHNDVSAEFPLCFTLANLHDSREVKRRERSPGGFRLFQTVNGTDCNCMFLSLTFSLVLSLFLIFSVFIVTFFHSLFLSLSGHMHRNEHLGMEIQRNLTLIFSTQQMFFLGLGIKEYDEINILAINRYASKQMSI